MDILEWLNEWYKSNCNGDWEHCYQIKIETLDNPGWWIRIDLEDTDLEDQCFENIIMRNTEDDWMLCRVEDNVFLGSGDPSKLTKMLEVFKQWAENINKSTHGIGVV